MTVTREMIKALAAVADYDEDEEEEDLSEAGQLLVGKRRRLRPPQTRGANGKFIKNAT
jgi:hypothetical protein